jgi:hypothetical protein
MERSPESVATTLPDKRQTDRYLAILIVILASLVPVVPLSLKYAIGIVIGIATLRSWKRSSFYLGLFVCICLGMLLTHTRYGQVVLLVAIGLYSLITLVVSDLRAGPSWLRLGTFTRSSMLLCVGIATVSGAALAGWFFLFKPNISDILHLYVPDFPLWLLVIGGLLFAVLNATVEEIAFRGIVFGALLHSAVPIGLALLLQALAFGAIHINGFPRGSVGVGLATIYGVFMGALRIRSKGLFTPWVCHIFVDFVIAVIVVLFARSL